MVKALDMDFGFFNDEDETRYCYVRLRVLKESLKDQRVLDALLSRLDVPGKSLAALKKLDANEKLNLIESQINHYRNSKTSVWYGVPAPEALAASIFRSPPLLPQKALNEIFCQVRRENDLLIPVANWLSANRFEPYLEIPLGTKRIDVLGYKKGLFLGSRLVGVELKNELSQFERALDQMTTFGQYAQTVYVACTPFMAAHYLDRHSEARGVHQWDASVFRKKLESFGFGLLIVEGQNVYEVLKPRERQPEDKKFKEAITSLSKLRTVQV